MKYYFIGIKGSGMSSLASILFDLGNEVSGFDNDDHYKYTEDALNKRGIKIYYDNTYEFKSDVVIYSPAIRSDHPEMVRAKEHGLKVLIYNEMLGELSKQYETTAICGCHGKTTTTALLSHVLTNTKDAPGANYLIGDGTGFADRNNELFIIEACEFKRHFLDYYPKYIIMTNIEYDHVDYYKDLEDVKSAFLEFSTHADKLIIACGDDRNIRSLNFNKEVIYYGFNEDNNVIAKNIVMDDKGSSFDVYMNNVLLGHFDLPLFGYHMILNALSVIIVSHQIYSLNIDEISKSIKSFKGANRRFKVSTFGDIVTIDDYAHHPTELRVTIESARQKYPDKEIVAVYLPNTYSRTKELYKDEAESLNKADKAYIMDIKADREKQSEWPGITSDLVLNLLHNGEKISLEAVDKLLAHKNAVIIFMSCTSIYIIKEAYEGLLTN